MAKRQQIHVTNDNDASKWNVIDAGTKTPVSVHRTKVEAVRAAVDRAKQQTPSQVVIHGKDGKIKSERTYQADPYPPQG
jgi:hypothetical protein